MLNYASTLLSAAVHLEGDKEIVVYQDELEGEYHFTTSSQWLVPPGLRVVTRDTRDGEKTPTVGGTLYR